MIDCSYKDIEWCNKVYHKSDECMVDGSIIVPDFMDDIVKVLSVKAYPSISDTKTDSGKISLSGQVKFNVIYIGESSPDKLFTLTCTVPFTHAITAPFLTNEYISLACVNWQSASHTLINSRRIKVSSSIFFCASSFKKNYAKILSSAQGAEQKQTDLTLTTANVIARKSIVITADCDLPSGKDAIESILRSDVKISDWDYKILNNKLIVKGNLTISALYHTSDSLTDASVSSPFTFVTEIENLSSSDHNEVSIDIAEWELKKETDLSGDYKMLDLNLVVTVSVTSFSAQTVQSVADLFLPGGKVKTVSESFTANDISPSFVEEEFVRESLILPENMPQISKIIDIDANPVRFSFQDNLLEFNTEITLIYLSSEEVPQINSYTFTLPLSHKFSLINPSDASCALKHISYTISSPSSIDIRLTLAFTAICSLEKTFTVFTQCEECDYTPEKRPSIVVSFMGADETIWDIAKKYNISPTMLCKANALEENSPVLPNEKLIIPR